MHTILLLICALAVADIEPPLPCGPWLVNNGDTTEVELSPQRTDKKGQSNRMDLTCKTIGSTPRQIIFNSRRFDNVKCDATGFWGNPVGSGKLQPKEVMAHAGHPLAVSCAEYCTVTTDEGAQHKLKYYTTEVSCADDTFDLYHNNMKIDGNVAQCQTTGWSQMYLELSLPIDNLKSQHFKCRKAPPRCTHKPTEGVRYDALTKQLSCDGGDTLWKIEYNSVVYESLHCAKKWGTYFWMHGDNILAEASPSLAVACIKPCSIRPGKRLLFNKDTMLASCVASETSIMKIRKSDKDLDTELLKCDANGWSYKRSSDYYEPLVGPYDLRETDCFEYCGSSGEGTVVKRIDSSAVNVSCSEPGFGIVVKSKIYKTLTCDIEKYWRSENWTSYIEIAKPSERLDGLTCKKLPRTCGIPTAVRGMEFDNEKKTLTCEGGGARAMLINSRLYEYLACDEVNGWAGRSDWNEGNQIESIADADLSENVTCIEYCKAVGSKIHVTWELGGDYKNFNSSFPWFEIVFTNDLGYITVTCASGKLYHNDMPVMNNGAKCSLRKGWRSIDKLWGGELISGNVTTPMQFECRSAPTTTTTSTTATISSTMETTMRTITKTSKRHPFISTTKAPSEKVEAQSSAGVIAGSIGGALLLVGVIVARQERV